jgi:hypothetical protein
MVARLPGYLRTVIFATPVYEQWGYRMLRKLFYTAAIIGIGASLGACASSVTASDLYRPGFGINPVPVVNLDAPYVRTPYSYGSQQPCLMANARCTPDMQLQWAQINQR